MTKLFTYTGGLWLAWVLISVMFGDGLHGNQSQYALDVGNLSTGDVKIYQTGGRAVIVVHRSDTMLECLQSNTAFLYDASPHLPHDPGKAELIVIFAHEPELGCPVEFVPADGLYESKYPLPDGAVWCGGFRDGCRGSLFDLSGRVYRNQGGQRNLITAPYHMQGNSVFISIQSVK